MARIFRILSFLGSLLLALPFEMKADMVEHHGFTVDEMSSSMNCIACHDGSAAAKYVSFCTSECNFNTAHAIDKPYPPLGRENKFAPVDSLGTSGIRLYGGNITCISCHNLKNHEKHHPAGDRSNGELCTLCHIM